MPSEYILGKAASKDYVDLESGEIICPANGEISLETLAKLAQAGYTTIETLFTNDLDYGPYISETLRVDPTYDKTSALYEILSYDAPWRATNTRIFQKRYSIIYSSLQSVMIYLQ